MSGAIALILPTGAPARAVFEAEYELELGEYCETARDIHFSAIGKSEDLFAKPWRPC
ncbi:MAG TPA: hypothetical protein VN758_13625 [Solirubrobacterales bacterium]|nr:hypothetical protein [Solirubrobacterales bacterium]